ncbi:MAG: bifunctional ADP-dependent NAD(P)H-hydrate dehydratase/NAD(P)H-hydrate epimerase [Verrucomicrobia bacterium 12-59-8]|nr:MAG: bifunctional ADP-dependent NAD(P)H-hydrate dehydratase/NAD(P)H-hydrate epimerase [Verrucomicrobia bacterium 12-59-8]
MNTDTALLTVSQMSESDSLTVAAGTSAIVLMENAGRAVAQEIIRRSRPCRVSVLCGPGNNGGDGFVAARHLAEAGWPVRVALLGTREHLTGEARYHAEQWLESIEPMNAAVLDKAELVVDAIFGAGLSRALEGAAADTLAAAASLKIPIVAIDVPSGLMGDTGEVLGSMAAVFTVTFFRKKPGHLLLPGRMLCGEVVVADIGIAASTLEVINPNTFENDPALWLAEMPRLGDGGNKYTRGHALICGGYPVTGASRMAARAASRAGAGLTTIAVPEIAFPIYAGALTSIMVHPLVKPEDVDLLLEDHRFTAFLVGPGCGAGLLTQDHARKMLATGLPTVIDADAITAFQDEPTQLDAAIVGPCVLTPHDGEFRRLFDTAGDKLTRTRAAAHRSGAIIVLKGSDTVITAPDGRSIINTNAPPTLATAGAGDVLSGIVLGLLAQGMDPFLAAAAAVWMHGAAATEFGPGLIAEDLADLLPGVLCRLNF